MQFEDFGTSYFGRVLESMVLGYLEDWVLITKLDSEDAEVASVKYGTLEFSIHLYWSAHHGPKTRLWFMRVGQNLDGTPIFGPNDVKAAFEKEALTRNKGPVKRTAEQEAAFIGILLRDRLIEYLSETRTQDSITRNGSSEAGTLTFFQMSSVQPMVKKYGEEFFVRLVETSKLLMPDLQIDNQVRTNKLQGAIQILAFARKRTYSLNIFYSPSFDEDEELQDIEGFGPTEVDEDIDGESWIVKDGNGKVISPKSYQYFKVNGPTGDAMPDLLGQKFVNSIRFDLGLEEVSLESLKLKEVPPKSTNPRFQTEDDILSLRINEKSVFKDDEVNPSARMRESRVPKGVLEFYSFPGRSSKWVDEYIKSSIKNQWVSWDNKETVIQNLQWDARNTAAKFFQGEYPKFNQVLEKFERRGTNPSFVSRFFGGSPVLPSYRAISLSNKRSEFIDELSKLLVSQSRSMVQELIDKSYGATPADWSASVGNRWQPLGPRPIVPPGGLTPKQAETYASQMLKFYGLTGVKQTRFSRDGGIDVESDRAVFQVKHQAAPVGVQVVREIYGVSASLGKHAGVFAKSGYTKDAVAFAEKANVLIFSYLPTLRGRTKMSESALKLGFGEFWKD